MSTQDLDSIHVGEHPIDNGSDVSELHQDTGDEETSRDGNFIERMQVCASRAGSVNALARKADLSQSGIRRYFAGGEPTRKVLIAIAQAADVDFRWLATGEGRMSRDGSGSAGYSSLPRLDGRALRQAIETVEEMLADSPRKVSTERKADMVAAAYELFMDAEGKIDKGVVLRLIRSAV
jgi:DNA-binding phage protein